jgi:hypothetical protein
MKEMLSRFFKKFKLEEVKGKAFLLTKEGLFIFEEGKEKYMFPK